MSSNNKKQQKLFESWRRYLNEKADPSKVPDEYFPMKLSDVGAMYTPGEATAITKGGQYDDNKSDDVISAQPGSVAVSQLKPSQSSMNIEKAVAFAIAAILKNKPFANGPGGDLGAIITNDNHIMDGHHRWIASGMVDPTVDVGGFVVDFPAKKLIAVLNVLTLHFTKSSKGKPGGGSFKDFTAKGVFAVLTKYAKEGVWSANKDPAMVIKACETFTGKKGQQAIKAAAIKMAKNLKSLTLSVPGDFPEREDMPIISKGKGHLKLAIKLLNSGAVDVNQSFAGDSGAPGGVIKQKAKGVKNRKDAERYRKQLSLENKKRKTKRKK